MDGNSPDNNSSPEPIKLKPRIILISDQHEMQENLGKVLSEIGEPTILSFSSAADAFEIMKDDEIVLTTVPTGIFKRFGRVSVIYINPVDSALSETEMEKKGIIAQVDFCADNLGEQLRNQINSIVESKKTQ